MGRWYNKPKPNTLRNLIRFSVKAVTREPEQWQQILMGTIFAAKSNWNISDEETIRKIAGKVYEAAKKALAPSGKLPEDFIKPMEIQAPEFHPTKIDGVEPLPVEKDATNELPVAVAAGQ